MRHKAIPIFLLILFVMATGFITKNSAVRETNDYHGKIATFFSKIKDEQPGEAIDFLYSDNPWISNKTDAVKQLKGQLTNLTSLVGEYQDKELLTEKVVAKRYAYLYYFVAYDRQPVKFVFEFYKPKDKWMIFSFSFNAEIDDEIEQGIKATLFYDLPTKE